MSELTLSLNDIQTQEVAVKQRTEEEKRTLVIAYHLKKWPDGTRIDTAEFVRRMGACGLSSIDLENRSLALGRRISAREQFDRANQAAADYELHKQDIQKFNDTWKPVFEKHKAESSALAWKSQQLIQVVSGGALAERDLQDSVGEHVRVRLAAVSKSMDLVRHEKAELERVFEAHEAAYLTNKRNADAGVAPKAVSDYLPQSLQELQRKRDALTAKEAEAVELNRQYTELLACECLDPFNF